MTYAFKPLIAGAIFAASLTPLGAFAATDSAMSLATVPCSQAVVAMKGTAMHGDAMHGDAMHADAMKGDAMKGDAMHGDAMKGDAMHGEAMKGDGAESLDKTYAAMASEHTKTLMELAKLEMRCGANAKAKAAAESALPDLQQILTTLRVF